MSENNNIKVNEASIKDIFFQPDSVDLKKYIIPAYQRDYKWDTENINTLLEDIQSRQRDGKEHYFGMIATSIETEKGNFSRNILKIMDGQQRIVTSFLILYFLHKLSKKQVDQGKNTSDVTNETKLTPLLENGISNLKSISNFMDFEINSSFSNSLKSLINDEKIPPRGSNLYKNSEKIKTFLTEKVGVKNFLSFENTFMNKFFVGNINYKSTTIDEEMVIFENINAKGVALNDFEMISNYLISLPSIAKGEELREIRQNATKLISKHITSVPKTFKNNNSVSSNINNDKLLIKFLETYLKYKIAKSNHEIEKFNHEIAKSNIDIKEKKKKHEYQSFLNYRLYKNFRNYFKDIKDKKGISFKEYKGIIHEISAFLVLYLSFKTGKGVIKDNIWLSSYTEKDNHFSVLFAIFDKFTSYKSTKKGIQWEDPNFKDIKFFSKSIVEYHLKHLSVLKQGKSLSPFWHKVLKEMVEKGNIQDNEKFRRFLRKTNSNPTPTNKEFRISLLRGENKITEYLKALVIILNGYGEKKNNVNEKITFGQRTIEHVFPQKPRKISEWPKFPEDKEEYKHCINMIGNFVLLDKKANSQLGNSNFQTKKKKVFVKSSSPLIKGESLGLININKQEHWGPEVIEKRTNKLITILEEIFGGDFI